MRVLSQFILYYYVLCCHGNGKVLCSPNVFVLGNIHLIVDKNKKKTLLKMVVILGLAK